MNRRTRLIIGAFLLACASRGSGFPSRPLTIVENGRTQYRIVVARDASPVEKQAARELRRYFGKMTGAVLPIRSPSGGIRPHDIILGKAGGEFSVPVGLDTAALDEDGFAICTDGSTLFIIGGKGKGTLYGVYELLEDVLGCRKYSSTVCVVPKRKTVIVDSLCIVRNPFFVHREIHSKEAWDRGYSDWHKLDSRTDTDESWGMWVHTFDRLIPARVYFKDHPESFSELGGRRIPNGQLCLTAPGVFPLLVRNLRRMVDAKPGARTWSVSQNDNANDCRCAACLAANERFGSVSGTLLDFVNRVAREFPDMTISTLAYWYTRTAPVKMRPDPNVNIMLCSIECNRSRPIEIDPSSASFQRDVEDWTRLTGDILMWDYTVQFRNLVSPFPNLRVLGPNIRYFAKHGIRKMFQQGCGQNVGEFHELRTYLIAKLLWNPDADTDSLITDFCDGYYGPAGPFVREYIDFAHNALEASGKGLNIYGYPYDAIGSYLTPALLKTYTGLFDRAETAVKDRPEFLFRVRTARLPLEFAILDISLRNVNPDLSCFDTGTDGWTVKPVMKRRLDNFVRLAKRAGITRLEEGGTSPDEYRRSVEKQWRVSVKGNLAFGKPVLLHTTASEKYPVGGGKALTDGLHGTDDYHVNWLGFEDNHGDAVIDLGQTREIRLIRTAFLQNINAWIWLPLDVVFSTSEDGVRFTGLASVSNPVPEEQTGAFTMNFDADAGGRKARFVRVQARSRLTCPDWHIGAGGKAWIFIDEIVVE